MTADNQTHEIADVNEMRISHFLDSFKDPKKYFGKFKDGEQMHCFSTMLSRWNKLEGRNRGLRAGAKYDYVNNIVTITCIPLANHKPRKDYTYNLDRL